jgi:hypothetical protein
MFILVNRGDGLRAYDSLDENNEISREYLVQGDGEDADDNVHVNTCKSDGSLLRPWLSPTETSRMTSSHPVFERLRHI